MDHHLETKKNMKDPDFASEDIPHYTVVLHYSSLYSCIILFLTMLLYYIIPHHVVVLHFSSPCSCIPYSIVIVIVKTCFICH